MSVMQLRFAAIMMRTALKSVHIALFALRPLSSRGIHSVLQNALWVKNRATASSHRLFKVKVL
jgi:hypothetical protein